MYTSPQRMLLEMDERTRVLQRQVRSGDLEALQAYYSQIARSGGGETIERLAILGDPVAREITQFEENPLWSRTVQIQHDIWHADAFDSS